MDQRPASRQNAVPATSYATFAEAITALIDSGYRDSFDETRDVFAVSSPQLRIAFDVFSTVVRECQYGKPGLPLDQLRWGTFDNCREEGLTVSAAGWTFCAYGHRIASQIHANGSRDADVQPFGPYGGWNHWDTLGSVELNEADVMGCAMVAAIRHVIDNPGATRESVKQAMWAVDAE